MITVLKRDIVKFFGKLYHKKALTLLYLVFTKYNKVYAFVVEMIYVFLDIDHFNNIKWLFEKGGIIGKKLSLLGNLWMG